MPRDEVLLTPVLGQSWHKASDQRRLGLSGPRPGENADADHGAALELQHPLVEFARELISTPSPTGGERDAGERLATELETLGYREVEVDDVGNVVGYFGDGPPRLMFNGHLDHVPVAGMADPFAATIEPGSTWGESGWAIRGRGSCDMKANVAAGAYAVAELNPGDLHGSYVFTADVQEEIDSPAGLPSLLERGVRADFGLSGESTGLSVAIGHRGKLQAEIAVRGRSSHASSPERGRNAVFLSVPLLNALQQAARDLPADPLFGPATLTVTAISSEPQAGAAVVPSLALIRVDRRWIPSETRDECIEALAELVRTEAGRSGIDAELRVLDIDYPLMQTPPSHPLVAAGQRAVADEVGRPPAVIAWRFGVNATFMSQAGIPTIGIGPGDERWAHTPDEHVPVSELLASAGIYRRLIAGLCGPG